jgi:hypothetical protein
MSVKIPVKEFAGLDSDNIISGIVLRQHHSSAVTNQLFLDQIEFLPSQYPETPLTSNAVLTKAQAYGNHVDLLWQVPLTPSIRYVKIYRSEDNKDFKAVGIRPTYMLRCLDFVPILDKKYYYKIAWVDYNYRESPFSEVLEVEPKKLSEDHLLDLIQLANVNYFVDNYDINSGMYMPFRMKDKAPVSVRETGGAMLSMLIGVEKGFVSKPLFLSRVKRIVDFLGKAQNNKGFYPAYFDGRKGLPIYLDDQPRYDIQATTSLMEALLIIRQYLTTRRSSGPVRLSDPGFQASSEDADPSHFKAALALLLSNRQYVLMAYRQRVMVELLHNSRGNPRAIRPRIGRVERARPRLD